MNYFFLCISYNFMPFLLFPVDCLYCLFYIVYIFDLFTVCFKSNFGFIIIYH